jgi:hypothetical protein
VCDAWRRERVELIQLFSPGASAKNGADIKLCLDATEDMSRFDHIGTIIVVGGDSDFMPVAQKIKAAGRTLVGVGTKKNTNRHWAKSCHEFRYYENLVEEVAGNAAPAAEVEGSGPVETPAPVDPAADILKRAVRLLLNAHGTLQLVTRAGRADPQCRVLSPLRLKGKRHRLRRSDRSRLLTVE